MSILRFAEQPAVSWGRFGRYGEAGTWGYQIDASGLSYRNRLMHRDFLPATSDVSLQTRIRLKSSLITSNPAFEGVAIRHRGHRMTGLTPADGDVLVWDSTPSTQGKRAWITEQTGTFKTYNFVNNIPEDLGIDYVSWEVVVRGAGGQVDIDDVECRYYYGKSYNMDIPGYSRWDTAAFTQLARGSVLNGEQQNVWTKNLSVQTIKCRKGQNLLFDTKATYNGTGTELLPIYPAQSIAPAVRGFLCRLTREGGAGFDYINILSDTTTGERYAPVTIGESISERAKYNYTERQLFAFIDVHPDPTNTYHGPLFHEHQDVAADLIVADFVAPSQ